MNEVCVQAIGAGNMIITFFAQNPTVYNAQQVTIWEGKFRNFASISKSTRGWTSTIRFGQPKIVGEDGKDYRHNYPRTIQHDIQRRLNLPPPPYETPGEIDAVQLWTYSYLWVKAKIQKEETREFLEINLDKDLMWTCEYTKYKENYNEEIPPYLCYWVCFSWLS